MGIEAQLAALRPMASMACAADSEVERRMMVSRMAEEGASSADIASKARREMRHALPASSTTAGKLQTQGRVGAA